MGGRVKYLKLPTCPSSCRPRSTWGLRKLPPPRPERGGKIGDETTGPPPPPFREGGRACARCRRGETTCLTTLPSLGTPPGPPRRSSGGRIPSRTSDSGGTRPPPWSPRSAQTATYPVPPSSPLFGHIALHADEIDFRE